MPERYTSLVKSLFLGEVHEELAFPYPQLDAAESDKVESLLKSARRFLDEHYDPREVEEQGWIGDDIVAGLAERGLLGLYVSEEYGGQGLSETAYCRIFEELSTIDVTLAFVLGVHQSIGMRGIHRFGTEEQKARFLPDMAAGRKLAGFAMTEPNVGSDAYHVETRAVRQPDGSWKLSGEKRWIGNGSKDVITVLARTEMEDEHILLIVEKGMGGFEVGRSYETMGFRGNDLRHLYFREVQVPPENVLGEPGDGYRLATEILTDSRLSMASGALGVARRCLDLALDHVRERHQFDRQLKDFELVKMKVGWMISQLYGLESATYLTTGMVDAGLRDYSVEGALVKVATTEYAWYAANRAFQLAGGLAYMADQPYEKILRDIRPLTFLEGANDVLRALVALSGLKELGGELEDLRHLDFKEPLRSLGAIAEYAGERIRLEVRPDRITRAHPELSGLADPIAEQVKRLRITSERLLRQHGKEVVEPQGQIKRLASATSDIYCQIAVLSRISSVIEAKGSSGASDERRIAEHFLQRASGRVERALDQIEGNDDSDLTAIAQDAYSKGGYEYSL